MLALSSKLDDGQKLDGVRALKRPLCLEIPMVVENVRGAQKFMGPARAHFGKQYLWGDVPPLLPSIDGMQNEGRQKQSLSGTRKAERAKIPFPLARWIAQVYKPQRAATPGRHETKHTP